VNAQIKSESGGGEGVGFAIPVDTVERSLRELRQDGRVEYGYLGVTTLALWPQLARRLELNARDGGLVVKVEEDSPAEEAGLRAGGEEIEFQATPVRTGGDVILAVDGRRLTRTQDLADVISAMSAGQRVELEVLRDGRRRTIDVELGQRPAESG
jgi:S1-C subfamily serine protease